MLHNPTFVITLAPEAVQRLGRSTNRFKQKAGGTDDLWVELPELEHDDVLLITIDGESEDERVIGDAIRTLEGKGIIDQVFGVHHHNPEVYLVASVMHGGLIEYQVSDGPPCDRGNSFDCYEYKEARRLFDNIVEKGWKEAAKM